MSDCDLRVRGLLVCPACRAALRDVPGGLACAACGLRYPVVDGVPWMIPEEATPWRADPSPVDPVGGSR